MRIPDFLAARAGLDPDVIALVDTRSGAEYDYAELSARAGRIAAALADRYGVSEGDRVALLSGNRAEVVETLFACARVGAIAVPLNWRLSTAELRGIVADCEPVLLLSDERHVATAAELPVKTACFDAADWLTAVEQADASPGWGDRRDDDTWYLLYTSGTTGRPKGVVYTFGMAVANHVNIGTAIDLTSADVTLNALPTFHTGGINLYTVPTLIAGGTAILAHEFEPGPVLDLLSGRATAFFGVPTMYRLLADHPSFDDTDLSGMRSWASGGSAMPVPLLHRLAERGIVVRQGMGMTETGPTLFLVDTAHAISKAGSVGKPRPLAQVRLVGVDGDDGPDRDEGELLIRGAGVTPGYWNRPDATAEAFTADGWLRSGDVARRDADGYYWIVDRVKDMYISGGENVYPAEVERVLSAHPAIAEAAVVGVPDERWGETGQAVVVADAPVDADELRAHCRAELASYKIPGHFVVVDSLPRNASGKVLKRRLVPVTWRESRVVTQADIDAYAARSGDDNPVHIDAEYAAGTVFGGTIAHGMLVFAFIRAAVLAHHPGRDVTDVKLSFPAATTAGSTIDIDASVVGATVEATVRRDDGTVVCRFTGVLA